jgi:3-oxoacyl-ACP reductase-like protein
MAFSLLALLHPALVVYAQRHPLWADLSGGLKEVKDLQAQVERIREAIFKISSIKSAVAVDARFDKLQHTKVCTGQAILSSILMLFWTDYK